MKIPRVRDWMLPTRLKLKPEMDIREAIDKMVEFEFFAAPVVNNDGRLVGLLTEKDCLRVLATTAYEDLSSGGHVLEYMSEVKLILEPKMDMFRAAQMFLQCNFPTLAVVDGDELVGSLRRQEMLRCAQGYIKQAEKDRRKRSRRARPGERPRGIQAMQETAAQSSPEGLAKHLSRNR